MSFWEDLRKFPNFVMIQPNERYDEFDYIRDLLNRIEISDKFIFIVDTNWIKRIGFPFLLLEKYIDHAKNKNLKLKIVLLNLGEGHDFYKFENEILQLNVKYLIDNNDIITFTLAIPDDNYPIKHAISYRATCREDILPSSNVDIIPTHHFISLTRMPRLHRLLANVEILKRNLDSYGFYSIFSMAETINNGRILKYVDLIPEIYRNKFPTYLDGNTKNGLTNDWFYTTDSRITHAAIHLVQETSYEFTEDEWGTPVSMISEKSMKPLAWGQLPLFLCFKNQVQKIRELGFDVFDDIIDHSYDNVDDPNLRIQMVIDELEKLCNLYTVADLQQYKQANMHRFIKNRQKTLEFFQNEKWEYSLPNLKKALI